MGLFSSKNKDEVTARITDFITKSDATEIIAIIGPKRVKQAYGKYTGLVDDLMQAVNEPERPLGKKEIRTILYAVGCMTKIEPVLIHIFNPAIEKMRAFLKL